MTAFPEWMGPNIEARHVEMMGWSVDPVPELGPSPRRPALPKGERNRYDPSVRCVVELSSGRQLVFYAPGGNFGVEAVRRVLDAAPNDPMVRWAPIPLGRDLWLGEGDAARCHLVADGRKAPG